MTQEDFVAAVREGVEAMLPERTAWPRTVAIEACRIGRYVPDPRLRLLYLSVACLNASGWAAPSWSCNFLFEPGAPADKAIEIIRGWLPDLTVVDRTLILTQDGRILDREEAA